MLKFKQNFLFLSSLGGAFKNWCMQTLDISDFHFNLDNFNASPQDLATVHKSSDEKCFAMKRAARYEREKWKVDLSLLHKP